MALQGAFAEHVRAFEAAGARTRLVRLAEDLAGLDGLVIPGGESTTITMLMERMGLFDAVREAVLGGLPTLGTCAGMIILATHVSDGIDGQRSFGALDIDVRRNGYGRQLESFEAPLTLEGDPEPFPGVFIRAPLVEDAGTTEVIASYDGQPVGVAFHPELSGDLRLHREFLRLVRS
jgi:pyridoxal 5'-phosphate synthase pdxT subunit